MRLRFGILALVLVAAVSGCGGDDKKNASSESTSSAPTSETSVSSEPSGSSDGSVDCTKFLEGQAKAAELASQLTPGTDLSSAIEAAGEQFEALKAGAPDDIRTALDAVKDAFTQLAEQYKNPTSIDPAEVQGLLEKLQANALTLNTFVSEHCTQ